MDVDGMSSSSGIGSHQFISHILQHMPQHDATSSGVRDAVSYVRMAIECALLGAGHSDDHSSLFGIAQTLEEKAMGNEMLTEFAQRRLIIHIAILKLVASNTRN